MQTIGTKTLKYVVFNAYRNVPSSISRKDKLPLLRTVPEKRALSGFEAKLVDHSELVSASQIDWKMPFHPPA